MGSFSKACVKIRYSEAPILILIIIIIDKIKRKAENCRKSSDNLNGDAPERPDIGSEIRVSVSNAFGRHEVGPF